MGDWEIFGPADNSVASVIGRSAEELSVMIAEFGPEVYSAMRSVWFQHDLKGSTDFAFSKSQRSEVVRQISGFLKSAPHAFDRISMAKSNPTQFSQHTPQLARILNWWEILFGAYTPTGSQVQTVVVYVPVFDYGADTMIAKALTVAVDYDYDKTQSSKLSMSFKGIGLVGTRKKKVSTRIAVPDTSDAFQVAVPVELDLTEYVGPLSRDIRYTAKVVHDHSPVHLTPSDKNFNPIRPSTRKLKPVDFLTSTAVGVKVGKNISTSKGFDGTADATMPNGMSLGLEYSVSTEAEIGVVYTKIRKDNLQLQGWKNADGIGRILKG